MSQTGFKCLVNSIIDFPKAGIHGVNDEHIEDT